MGEVTRAAVYDCKVRFSQGGAEPVSVERKISLTRKEGESDDSFQSRLQKAAEAEAKNVRGCFDVHFVAFLPTAEEALARTKAASAAAAEARRKTAANPPPKDPCDGTMALRPMCKM